MNVASIKIIVRISSFSNPFFCDKFVIILISTYQGTHTDISRAGYGGGNA